MRPRRRSLQDWIIRFRDHAELPDPGSREWHELIGWELFGDAVPGLPAADSPEGLDLLKKAAP